MKNTRLIRTIFFAALLIALLFVPALAQSAVADSKQEAAEIEAKRTRIMEVSEAPRHNEENNAVVLYERVISELVKTFYIA
ncbi:MAG: hypothetical protein AAF564_25130 [Bacteroidota bacterium]